MTARHLVVWRHGQTDYNQQGRIQGACDVPLDQVGLAQAADAAAQVALLRPAAIWSSDLARAAATAAALASLTGLEVVADERLRERQFGQWEGLPVTEVAARWPALHQRWRAGEDLPEIGMETRDRAAARFAACALAAAAAAPDGSTAVLATHGGVAVCGITRLLELDPVRWLGLRVMRNAHWAVLEGGGRRPPAWRLTGYDLGDLSGKAGLTPWA